MNRRNFVSTLLAAVPAALLFSKLGWAADPGADLPIAKESDPIPKSLNYCGNADKEKGKACKDRKDKEKATQYCNNCMFFTAAGKRGKDDVGKCQVITTGLVNAKGW